MDIGKAIRELRKEAGIKQGDLAADAGISSSSLSQIEKGHKRPTERTLEAISKVLGVPSAMIYLLGIEESDVPNTKKGVYTALFPTAKELLIKMLKEEPAV